MRRPYFPPPKPTSPQPKTNIGLPPLRTGDGLSPRHLTHHRPSSPRAQSPSPHQTQPHLQPIRLPQTPQSGRANFPPPGCVRVAGQQNHNTTAALPVRCPALVAMTSRCYSQLGVFHQVQGSVVRGKGRVGETTVQGSKQASFRGARTRRETRWVGRRKNSSSVSTQSHGNGKKSLAGFAAAAAAACRGCCSYSFPLCFVPSGDGPMRNSFPVQVFSLPHTTWR